MRFIITAHPAPDTKPADPNAPLDEALFTSYMTFNEVMFKAGVLVAAEGLNPAGKSAQVAVKGGKRVVTDGPFAETKELVGGFYILEVNSIDEVLRTLTLSLVPSKETALLALSVGSRLLVPRVGEFW